MCTGWENTVDRLTKESCNNLSVSYPACVQPWLKHVVLHVRADHYLFDPKADIPPGTCGTMIVLLLPPSTVRDFLQLCAERKHCAERKLSHMDALHSVSYKFWMCFCRACKLVSPRIAK